MEDTPTISEPCVRIHPVPIPSKRLDIPLSLVRGSTNNKILGYKPLREVLNGMVNKKNKSLVEFTHQLDNVRSDRAKYSDLKNNSCPGFIVGNFAPVRQDDNCEVYVPLIGFDIDSLADEFDTDLILADCRNVPHIFLAYPSPSRKGLRIFIWCEVSPNNHKVVYEAVCEMLSDTLRLKTDKAVRLELKAKGLNPKAINIQLKQTEHIDTSTKNISRLWFYTLLDKTDIYLNEQSEVFKLPLPTTKIKPKRPQTTQTIAVPLDQTEKVRLCAKMAAQRNITPGRNNGLYSLACLMVEHGVNQSEITRYCLGLEEVDFNEAEIIKTINSAIKRADPHKFNDVQLIRWRAKVEGAPTHQSDKKPSRLTPALAKEQTVLEVKNEEEEDEVESEVRPNSSGKKSKFIQIKEHLSRRYQFRLNTISNEIEYRLKKSKNKAFLELNENDLICELLTIGWSGVEAPLIALLKSSYVPKYNPFRDYFEHLLPWDETQPDYIELLANYVSAKDQKWFNYQFKKMLVRSVACALDFIDFNKHCFTMQGKQNDGKTSFIRFLCPKKLDKYFKENLDVHNKDGRLALCQNLYINLDELATFSKYDINKTKAFFTIDKVKDRMPYDKKPSNFRRTASFFASTNQTEILTDETGNVRWLIFEINHIYHDKGGPNGYNQNVNIDLVYSQAYSLLKSGFDFKLSAEDIAKSEKNNKAYQVMTLEGELIQDLYAPALKSEENELGVMFLTTTDIKKRIDNHTNSPTSIRKIGQALKMLGYQQFNKRIIAKGASRRGYYVRWLLEEDD